MTFSKEEMEILSKYEQYFHTATKANYTRNPGRVALQEMHGIFKSATGSAIRLNTGCGHCIYSLVKAVAVAYYKDKEEMEKIKACISDKCEYRVAGTCRLLPEEQEKCPLNKEVKAEAIEAKTEAKVPVKTKTKKAKK